MPTCRPKIAETRHELGMVAAIFKKEKKNQLKARQTSGATSTVQRATPEEENEKKRHANESQAEDGFLFS